MRSTPSTHFPDTADLAAGLEHVLAGTAAEGPVTIVGRERHLRASTFPVEVVTCMTAGGHKLELFCKYSGGCEHNDHGHRGGIRHEAAVYERVLQPLSTTAPRFYGTYEDPQTGWVWLIVEHLDGTERASSFPDGIAWAAAWIGSFHARNEQRLKSERFEFLPRYDEAYYRGWVERTIALVDGNTDMFPGLSDLIERAGDIFQLLQASPPTIIHGEYYSPNVLCRDGFVSPIDWESTAIAAGEIDVASLTQGWDTATSRAAEKSYCQARWPYGEPKSFYSTVQAARIYFLFRWLGNTPFPSSLERRQKWYRQEYASYVGAPMPAL